MKSIKWTQAAERVNGLITTLARVGILAILCHAGSTFANGIAVTGITWNQAVVGQSFVQFNLSWQNSWRASWTEAGGDNVTGSDLPVESWDAAWVFVKYRLDAGSEWKHATLSTTAGTHLPPVGGKIDVGRTDDGTKGVGVFVYRDAVGSGNVNYEKIKVRWLHGVDGVPGNTKVDLAVYAIEMVNVAAGQFMLGDGGNADVDTRFRTGSTVATPFRVTATWDGSSGVGDVRKIGNVENQLWAQGRIVAGTLHNDFPTGYRAFYCMKYAITQGQYADFLNALTATQAGSRANTNTTVRNTISVSAGVYSASAPDRACGLLIPADFSAYACWAGLRPMTELEFEKACRGPLNPVLGEQAWGTIAVTVPSGLVGVDGSGSEYYTAGNSRFDLLGPVRVGIFAKPGSTREQSGASYWGIMELSGNVSTFVATPATLAGQAFRGLHGDGTLTAAGVATVSTWPLTGRRGIYWGGGSLDGVTSARRAAVDLSGPLNGGRAVRTAP